MARASYVSTRLSSAVNQSPWTRVPFKSLTDYLEHGRTLSEFLEDFPSVTSAEAIAAIEEPERA